MALLGALALVVVACSDVHPSMQAEADAQDIEAAGTPQVSVLSERGEAEPETEATPAAETDEGRAEVATAAGADQGETEVVSGVVVSSETGEPLAAAVISGADAEVVTGADGAFTIEIGAGEAIEVRRAARETRSIVPDDTGSELIVELAPLTVRALRVAAEVAADPARFADLLALAEGSVVNALVFDTKDESNRVLYETEVSYAAEIGAVDAVYDPAELLALAREQGLYTVTRIVTFEDGTWAGADGDAKLAGSWVDAGNRANWAYPIDLAVEACRIGFDEIQFDYVRFPAGRTSELAADLIPPTETERVATIADFLAEARERLTPLGCGLSAAIFGIVMSSETDERLGQTPEGISASVDAVSPMIYPSHYGPGWLGYDDPNDHPGPVMAHALDEGIPRVAADTTVRPWIQGFYYNADQVRAQISEAEARGAGWIIWNFRGNYEADWLPSS